MRGVSPGHILKYMRPLDRVQHLAHQMRLQDRAEFRVPACPANLFHLQPARGHLETPLPPSLIEPLRRAMRRDQSAKKNIAVEHNQHYRFLAQAKASRTASSTASAGKISFSAFARRALNSNIRALTASSTNFDRSPFLPPPSDARNCRSSESVSAVTTRFHRVAVKAINNPSDSH
jgi:hypothetical protein